MVGNFFPSFNHSFREEIKMLPYFPSWPDIKLCYYNSSAALTAGSLRPRTAARQRLGISLSTTATAATDEDAAGLD